MTLSFLLFPTQFGTEVQPACRLFCYAIGVNRSAVGCWFPAHAINRFRQSDNVDQCHFRKIGEVIQFRIRQFVSIMGGRVAKIANVFCPFANSWGQNSLVRKTSKSPTQHFDFIRIRKRAETFGREVQCRSIADARQKILPCDARFFGLNERIRDFLGQKFRHVRHRFRRPLVKNPNKRRNILRRAVSNVHSFTNNESCLPDHFSVKGLYTKSNRSVAGHMPAKGGNRKIFRIFGALNGRKKRTNPERGVRTAMRTFQAKREKAHV